MGLLRGRLWTLAALAAVGFMALAWVMGAADVRAQRGTEVSIVDFAFQPGSLGVAAGATVTWTNKGNAPHTVTSDNGLFDSGQIAPGLSFTWTFDTPGTYTYHCSIHPQVMNGSIVVVAPGQPLPGVGVGTLALQQSNRIAQLAGLAALCFGAIAVLTYRRA
jgi:plastocyanin